MKKIIVLLLVSIMLQGCAGMLISSAADATIAVAKVPFKVGGAIIDVAKGDDDDD